MKRFLAMMLVLGMSLSLVGCGKTADPAKPEGDKPTAEGGDKLAAKQEYNTYISSDPMTLDLSLRSDQYSSTILLNTLEGLTRNEAQADGSYKLVPAGAKEWSSNEDQTVWTFKLNDNKWDDGKAVTAQDYLYSIQRSCDPETGSPTAYDLDPIKNFHDINGGKMQMSELGVKAIDEQTLEITLAAPTPHFLELTHGMNLRPQREDFVKANGDKYGAEAATFIGCGPFTLKSWTHNNLMVLEKNPNYWDAENVTLEKVNCKIITDSNTVNTAFLNGEIDYARASKTEWVEKFSQVKDVQSYKVPSATATYSFFNTEDKLFSNANVRKAFITGINREELNQMCFSGMREPLYGWVVDALWAGDVHFREFAGEPIKEMASEGTPKEMLLKGMEELGLGTDPASLDVTFRLAGTDEWFRTLGEYLQQAYKTSLGINLKIDQSEWGIFIDNVEKGNFQIGFMGWGASYNEPYDVLSLFISTSTAIHTGWKNPEYDAMIKKAAVEVDNQKRAEIYKEAETLLIKTDAVVNPLACTTYNDFFAGKVAGTEKTTPVFGTVGWKSLSIIEK